MTISLTSQIARILASDGLAAAKAAAGNTTDPDVLRLIAHYQAAGCNPSTVAPMPPGFSKTTVWIYEPSGKDQCAYSSWDFGVGEPPPPLPEAAPPAPPTTYVLPSGTVIPPASAAVASAPGGMPSWVSTIPTWAWWAGAGFVAWRFLRR